MKNFILTLAILFTVYNCFSQHQTVGKIKYSDTPREISTPIMNSICEDFNNLNLFEYSHVLPELFSVLSKNKKYKVKWTDYIDSIIRTKNDTTESKYYASHDAFVILLQSSYFKNTINALNQESFANNEVLIFLKNSLKKLPTSNNISNSEILNNIKISDQNGGTNFWYFVQVFDCDFLQDIVLNDEKLKNYFLTTLDGYEIISTYKLPYKLQKLKWQNMKSRLSNGNECNGIVNQMNNREIGIFDDDKEYYKKGFKEGVNRLKEREF